LEKENSGIFYFNWRGDIIGLYWSSDWKSFLNVVPVKCSMWSVKIFSTHGSETFKLDHIKLQPFENSFLEAGKQENVITNGSANRRQWISRNKNVVFSWVECKQHNKRNGNPIISVHCMKLVFFIFVSNLVYSDCAKNYKLRVFLRNIEHCVVIIMCVEDTVRYTLFAEFGLFFCKNWKMLRVWRLISEFQDKNCVTCWELLSEGARL